MILSWLQEFPKYICHWYHLKQVTKGEHSCCDALRIQCQLWQTAVCYPRQPRLHALLGQGGVNKGIGNRWLSAEPVGAHIWLQYVGELSATLWEDSCLCVCLCVCKEWAVSPWVKTVFICLCACIYVCVCVVMSTVSLCSVVRAPQPSAAESWWLHLCCPAVRLAQCEPHPYPSWGTCPAEPSGPPRCTLALGPQQLEWLLALPSAPCPGCRLQALLAIQDTHFWCKSQF